MSASSPHIPLRQRTAAFSLLEALVAIVVGAVILMLGATTISSMRKSAGTARCLSNLRQLGGAIVAYATEHNGALPPGRDYTNGVKYWFMDRKMWAYHYLGNDLATARLFRCPSDIYATDNKNYYSYTWNVTFLQDLRSPNDPKVFLREAPGKILMADGASLAERAGEWPASDALAGTGPIHSGSKSGANLSKRHNDGANCLMGDGSMQWFRHEEVLTPKLLDRP